MNFSNKIIFQLICSVDPKLLKLTPIDDTIYKIFRKDFPTFNVKNVNEDEMKGPSGKLKWRVFCEQFKDLVEDYNFGTLLRTNCDGEYSEKNSMLVPRVQFLAIELARNREGLNDALRDKFKGVKDENKQ